MTVSLRRSRRTDSLAALVIEVLDDLECPVATTAIRIILNDRGRIVTAEQLGRLAAYQREDFLRTRIPPALCWAIDPNGIAVNPRWWALGDWRLQRRILTEDVKPVWLAHLADRLCLDLAKRPAGRDPAFVTLTLGAIAQALGERYFDVPATTDDWMALRGKVYAAHLGNLSNLAGATPDQHEAEASLQGQDLSAFELLFGREIR
jgi:hypothetical protein